jgi:hypothetical protein
LKSHCQQYQVERRKQTSCRLPLRKLALGLYLLYKHFVRLQWTLVPVFCSDWDVEFREAGVPHPHLLLSAGIYFHYLGQRAEWVSEEDARSRPVIWAQINFSSLSQTLVGAEVLVFTCFRATAALASARWGSLPRHPDLTWINFDFCRAAVAFGCSSLSRIYALSMHDRPRNLNYASQIHCRQWVTWDYCAHWLSPSCGRLSFFPRASCTKK